MFRNHVGITFVPTLACNTGCAHCLDNSSLSDPVHFPVEMARCIVDETRKEGYELSVLFTGGGEPLLHPELSTIAHLFGSYEKNEGMFIITSGFLEEEEVRRKNFRSILRSGYFSNQIEHSFNLFHASFPIRLINFLKMMYAHDKEAYVKVRMCVSLENCHATRTRFKEALSIVAEEIGGEVHELPLGELVTDKIEEDLENINEEDADFFPRLYVIRTSRGKGIIIEVMPISFEKLGRGKNIPEQEWGIFVCDALGEHNKQGVHLSIWPDGSVYPECSCPHVKNFCLGKIGHDPLSIIVARKEMFIKSIQQSPLVTDKNLYQQDVTGDCCRACQRLVADGTIKTS
jgi:MoaA/NifB/PqqE/SkfB family radical SAM enzyme